MQVPEANGCISRNENLDFPPQQWRSGGYAWLWRQRSPEQISFKGMLNELYIHTQTKNHKCSNKGKQSVYASQGIKATSSVCGGDEPCCSSSSLAVTAGTAVEDAPSAAVIALIAAHTKPRNPNPNPVPLTSDSNVVKWTHSVRCYMSRLEAKKGTYLQQITCLIIHARQLHCIQ